VLESEHCSRKVGKNDENVVVLRFAHTVCGYTSVPLDEAEISDVALRNCYYGAHFVLSVVGFVWSHTDCDDKYCNDLVGLQLYTRNCQIEFRLTVRLRGDIMSAW
jgi:hypothetical protein